MKAKFRNIQHTRFKLFVQGLTTCCWKWLAN